MTRTVRFFNTLSRSKEELKPLHPTKVGIYTCGPTVYNYQHVGNYRTYVFEDALVRSLKFLGYQPFRVMNVTDVGHLTSQADEGEDKMEVSARREGKTAWQIAEFYTQSFLGDCKALNLLPPDVLCRATDYIKEQIDLVQRLEKKGLIYRISDGMYYDTSKFKDYGRLAGQEHTVISHIGGIQIGARIEANPEKRHPADFALWKFSPAEQKRQMEWDSPWGKGFPGWHIECSAMAMRFLGETLDIHCGGVDHIPIHHTNEIAQSEGATGKPFVKIWMHGEFLLMNSAKMAKSSGGFVKLSDLAEKGFDPLDYRYHCLTAHYRKQLDFTWEALEAARASRRRLKEIVSEWAGEPLRPACADHRAAFEEALADDLNLPEALAVVWRAARDGTLPAGSRLAFLKEADEKVLGLDLAGALSKEAPLSAEAKKMFDDYVAARARKDFSASDVLRRQLSERGIEVLDTKDGSRWRKK